MQNHIFLEGPIREGKSTLLRSVLNPYMDYVGGFASQRLNSSDGKTLAYRIGPAATTELIAPFTSNVTGGHNGVFRLNTPDGKALKFPEVFCSKGVDYLNETAGFKIMLLDEIGGAEMHEQSFCNALYKLLSGDIPCVGVIKRYENVSFMAETAGYSAEIQNKNIELREKIIHEYNGKILTFSRNDMSIRQELENFLCGIFTIK